MGACVRARACVCMCARVCVRASVFLYCSTHLHFNHAESANECREYQQEGRGVGRSGREWI